jgi:[CysO sulfur-carrier protein]-thiocarboxylate-dependent cysteine synthase
MSSSPQRLTGAVGGTPLVELTRLSPKPGIRLYAKVEGQNPSGSVKDRIALAMIEELERTRGLRPGDTLVEASTGNTAIALALVARQRGYQLKVVVPQGVVPSIQDVLSLYGVEIVWAAPRCGMLGAIETAEQLARDNGWHAVRQFSNPVNAATHHRTTGAEIAAALPRVDVLVAGIGTGGTLMGVGRRLRERDPSVRLVGVEPRMGERLQGLRSMDEGFHPPLVDLALLSRRFLVGSADALRAMRRIVEVEGIPAGVSSGAALHAALRVAADMDEGVFVLMFSDSAWKYLPARPWDAVAQGDVQLDETHWW